MTAGPLAALAAPIAAVNAPLTHVLIPVACAVAALILVTWVLSIVLHDASVIDPVWGPAFALVALICALVGEGDAARRWLLCALTLAWGLRLGLHLTRRKLHERSEDRRYAAMRERHPGNFALWSLVAVYCVQGLMVVIISLPIQASAGRAAALGLASVPGIIVFLIGIGFEAVGDEQLRRFRAEPGSHGTVMDRGLWRYTRHPNYFGDACVWWGIWLIALPAGATWWTVIAPIVMTFFLVRVSGAGLMEKDIGSRRPGYAEYVRRTSGFVPLPPKRSG
jgi:steroid 5-alpha reductase family enzyme